MIKVEVYDMEEVPLTESEKIKLEKSINHLKLIIPESENDDADEYSARLYRFEKELIKGTKLVKKK